MVAIGPSLAFRLLIIRPYARIRSFFIVKTGSLKVNTALEYSTRVVQEGGRRCKKSTLNDLVLLTPLRIPLMNPPSVTLRVVIFAHT